MNQIIAQFESLEDPVPVSPALLPKICIVSGEFVGLFKNGGLGTSMTGLAELLVRNGFSVTVLYTGEIDSTTGQWVARYGNVGIHVIPLKLQHQARIFGPQQEFNWTEAWNVFEFLKDRKFDIIHFNDTQGDGCYCFLAKKFHIAFRDTLLTLAIHSPVEWILESNHVIPKKLWACLCISAERMASKCADLVWGPSHYLLGWLDEHDYELPEQVVCQQYVIPSEQLLESNEEVATSNAVIPHSREPFLVREIVFFGRLEERKGIRLFIKALTRLNSPLVEHGISVLFMGKQSIVDGMPTEEFVRKKGTGWKFHWRIEDSLDRHEAIAYLKSNPCLAVMASPVDNSPCTVYEALQHEIPFIACRSGGIPELISSADHSRYLFDYRTKSLADTILDNIGQPLATPRMSIPVAENQGRWLNFHYRWREYLPDRPLPRGGQAKWGIYLDCLGDGDVDCTLAAIQSLPDAGTIPVVLNTRDVKLNAEVGAGDFLSLPDLNDVDSEVVMRWLGERGVTHVLSLRAGIEPKSEVFAIAERALACKVDAVVPATSIAGDGLIVPPIAGCAAMSAVDHNLDSGAIAFRVENGLVKRALPFLNLEELHMGLLENLYSLGADISPLPASVVSARVPEAIIVPGANSARRLAAFSGAPSRDLYQIISVTLARHGLTSNRILRSTLSKESRLRRYVFSNPWPIRVVFGNSLARKVSKILSRLSHQE